MTTRMVSVWVALLLSLAIAGCTTQPLVNVSETPIVWTDAAPSIEKAEAAIKRALIARGWTGEAVRPGLIRGQINVRGKHEATVDIAFSDLEYTITYVDSAGLDYYPSTGTIHRNYNRWVLALSQEINKELSLAASPN